MDGELDWLEIFPPQKPDEAELAYERWRQAHPEILSRLRDQDVRKDVIRSAKGETLIRYLIIRNCLPK